MTRELAFPPCPACGCPSPSWSGSGASASGAWNSWECPRCGQEWREHFPAGNTDDLGDPGGAGGRLPCPVAEQCEGCGQQPPGLAAREADTPVGVVCLTLCTACVATERVPRWSYVGAAHRVLAHCGHTGRDLDGSAHPDAGAGPCLRCGRVFDEREDRPYCSLCEDGPHEPAGGERP